MALNLQENRIVRTPRISNTYRNRRRQCSSLEKLSELFLVDALRYPLQGRTPKECPRRGIIKAFDMPIFLPALQFVRATLSINLFGKALKAYRDKSTAIRLSFLIKALDSCVRQEQDRVVITNWHGLRATSWACAKGNDFDKVCCPVWSLPR